MTQTTDFLVFPFVGVHVDAATVHGKQGETKKAEGEITIKKKSFSRRTREEQRKTITEAKRRKEKDFQNVGTS